MAGNDGQLIKLSLEGDMDAFGELVEKYKNRATWIAYNMVGNYEDRKVALHEDEELAISTALVIGCEKPYETAVGHPDYNGGEWVIVEKYNTKEQAQRGHDRWVERMTREPLPFQLVDCQNSQASKLCALVGNVISFERRSKK